MDFTIVNFNNGPEMGYWRRNFNQKIEIRYHRLSERAQIWTFYDESNEGGCLLEFKTDFKDQIASL